SARWDVAPWGRRSASRWAYEACSPSTKVRRLKLPDFGRKAIGARCFYPDKLFQFRRLAEVSGTAAMHIFLILTKPGEALGARSARLTRGFRNRYRRSCVFGRALLLSDASRAPVELGPVADVDPQSVQRRALHEASFFPRGASFVFASPA